MNTPLSDRELHTVLAALRFYQERGQCDSANRSAQIQSIASNFDQIRPLRTQEIDRLCAKLNFPEEESS